jgi:hypothetical protein
MAHQAVRWIETRVQPANWDGQIAWVMVIFPLGTQTDDTKHDAGPKRQQAQRGRQFTR